MPIADLKKDDTLVLFRWTRLTDAVTVYGYEPCPNIDPLRIQTMKKMAAQLHWRWLVNRGYKHVATYENGRRTK